MFFGNCVQGHMEGQDMVRGEIALRPSARETERHVWARGIMVATPVLAGALLRIVMGIVVGHFGPKVAGSIGQVIVIAGLAWAWLHGLTSCNEVLLVGVILGMAGASFAVALPLASRWYPPQHQGAALGIAGAGNSGTVFAVRPRADFAGLGVRHLPPVRQGQPGVSAAESALSLF